MLHWNGTKVKTSSSEVGFRKRNRFSKVIWFCVKWNVHFFSSITLRKIREPEFDIIHQFFPVLCSKVFQRIGIPVSCKKRTKSKKYQMKFFRLMDYCRFSFLRRSLSQKNLDLKDKILSSKKNLSIFLSARHLWNFLLNVTCGQRLFKAFESYLSNFVT